MSTLIRQLDMELFGGCNYTCQMCPQGFEDGRESDFKKSLNMQNFHKIVDDAIEHGVESISLHGGGEPTLHKNFIECIHYIKKKDVKCVSFSNGYTLNNQLISEIANSGLDIFRVSVIGYSKETYREWMDCDGFNQVRENVKKLVKACKHTNTEVHANHLIIQPDLKEWEIQKYRENWVDYTGTQSEIWLMHNWSGGYDTPYARSKLLTEVKPRSCGRPFADLLQVRAGGIGRHTGAVVACCMVLGKDSTAVLGHLDDQSIEDVVSGEEYEKLRRAHRNGRFEDVSYCKDCDQLLDVPDALVWSNIPDRSYGQSKISTNLDHRTFVPNKE